MHIGVFQPVNNGMHISLPCYQPGFYVGFRVCPNPKCKTLVVVIFDKDCNIYDSFPPEMIDFDTSNIPESIVSTLREAISCHAAKCYIASAMLLRKTLEEICEQQSAVGKDLYQRIEQLKSKIILPHELLEALHDLRLLGNDAAHIESKTYNQISKEEVVISITLVKEILKGLYQYEALTEKLRSLKKSP